MAPINKSLASLVLVLFLHVDLVPAPVPRCSPFIFINKLAEFSNVLSDSNPYFPLPPCEYGGWQEAIDAGDYRAVFVFAEPLKIPRHNFYEFVWLLKTGLPRYYRMFTGQEPFVHDDNILREGYQHYTPHVRTNQIGTYKYRDPKKIDDKKLYNRLVGRMIGNLLTRGPDKEPTKNPHRPSSGGYRRPPPRRPSTSSYGAPTSSYGPPPSSYGAPKPQYGAPRPPRPSPQRPAYGPNPRPPRKTSQSQRGLPNLSLPIVQDSTGHAYPPQPEGATFTFQSKPRPKRLQSVQQAHELQGSPGAASQWTPISAS